MVMEAEKNEIWAMKNTGIKYLGAKIRDDVHMLDGHAR